MLDQRGHVSSRSKVSILILLSVVAENFTCRLLPFLEIELPLFPAGGAASCASRKFQKGIFQETENEVHLVLVKSQL